MIFYFKCTLMLYFKGAAYGFYSRPIKHTWPFLLMATLIFQISFIKKSTRLRPSFNSSYIVFNTSVGPAYGFCWNSVLCLNLQNLWWKGHIYWYPCCLSYSEDELWTDSESIQRDFAGAAERRPSHQPYEEGLGSVTDETRNTEPPG